VTQFAPAASQLLPFDDGRPASAKAYRSTLAPMSTTLPRTPKMIGEIKLPKNDSQTPRSSNIIWHRPTVTRQRRERQNDHGSAILWFTGLSGAGKSTLAHALEERLHQLQCKTFVLDGDNVRHGLCGDLGFSDEDRQENIRRVGETAKLFVEAGVITLTAFISPFQADRQRVRDLAPEDFIEIYCRCSLELCEARDVKGLYKRARKGEIKEFTGISSPYEEPEDPELTIDTGTLPLGECVELVIDFLEKRGLITPERSESERYDVNATM
jgi:adenylylsulfate kinase